MAGLRPEHPHFDGPSWQESVRAAGGFGEPREVQLTFWQEGDPERTIDYVASMSWMAALPQDVRAETLAKVAALVRGGETPRRMRVHVKAGLANLAPQGARLAAGDAAGGLPGGRAAPLASCSTSCAAASAGSCARDQRGDLLRARPDRAFAERALDGEAQRARREEAAGEAHAGAGPVEARGVLVHVAGGGAGDDGAAAGERAHERAVAGVADDDVAAGHRARVGDPLDEPGVVGHRQRARGQAPVPGGEHAHGRVGEPAQRGVQQPVLGVLGGGGRDEHERLVAGRQLDVGGRRLPHERPDDVHVRRASARGYSSCGNVATSASSRLMPPWTWASGGRPSCARVRLSSTRPRSRPRSDGQLGAPPERAPERRAGQARAERVDREVRARRAG